MNETMRAVVLDALGPPEVLQIRELPIPEPRPGWTGESSTWTMWSGERPGGTRPI
jgi:hypothetical protein